MSSVARVPRPPSTCRLDVSSFRHQQKRDRYSGDMGPINRYVDELHEIFPRQGRIPYVAPLHGGTGARVLSLLSSPGIDVAGRTGTQLLSTQNNSPAAVFVATQLARVGIPESQVLPWNAYPWFKGSGAAKLTPQDVKLGAYALKGIMELTRRLEVVLIQGRGNVLAVWNELEEFDVVRNRNLTVIESFSPGEGALRNLSRAEARERDSHRRNAFDWAAAALRSDLEVEP